MLIKLPVRSNALPVNFFYDTAYRFQLAGYRDEHEYLSVNKGSEVSRICQMINDVLCTD